MEKLIVDLGQRSYPICIGEGVLERLPQLFAEAGVAPGASLMVITDTNIAPLHLDRTLRIAEQAGYRVASSVVPAGEKSKSLHMLEQLIGEALAAGMDRNSVVVALGGGVVGDLAGYVAASFMRGVRFVQIPTTILAHDSSVGGKVAVNHPSAKNIIGAFHQPELVLFDLGTLYTLPERDVRAGLSEVIKHGLIWDEAFVDWCDANAERLLSLEPEALQHALYTGCKVKSLVVSQDERENGLRAILNLGHTIGHALEAVAGYNELLHGEAISIGMVGSARLAMRFGCPEDVYVRTKSLLRKFGLPIKLPNHLDEDSIIAAMMHDKKFRDGKTLFVLPTAIGAVEIRKDVPVEWVREVVSELKREE